MQHDAALEARMNSMNPNVQYTARKYEAASCPSVVCFRLIDPGCTARELGSLDRTIFGYHCKPMRARDTNMLILRYQRLTD